MAFKGLRARRCILCLRVSARQAALELTAEVLKGIQGEGCACSSSMRMSMEDEPVQTTLPAAVMSASSARRLCRWIASTAAVTSSGGRVSVRPSSLHGATHGY